MWNDLERALTFYRPVLATLGLEEKFTDLETGWAAWRTPGTERPLFIVGRPFDKGAAAAGNGAMTAFMAPTRGVVDTAYAAAIDAGGSCDGPPGPRPHYHPDYYGAYVRDLEGNKICVVCHEPAPPD